MSEGGDVAGPKDEPGLSMPAAWRIAVAAVAAMFLLAGVALGAQPAQAAAKEQVALSVPEAGQLSIARLEFKVKGVAKPKLKIRAQNEDELPAGAVAVAQSARYEKKRGRAVVLVAIANPAAPGSRTIAKQDLPSVAELKLAVRLSRKGKTGGQLAIDFYNDPLASHNFVGVVGAEPPAERQLGREVFDLDEGEYPDGAFGEFDLDEATEFMKLQLGPLTLIGQEVLFRAVLIRSALAALLGPPAAIDAEVYGFVTGMQPPQLSQATAGQSPANPSVVFVDAAWNIPVMGVQVSQSSGNTLLDTPDARCANGLSNFGTVTVGPGPFLGLPGVDRTYRLDCDLPQDTPRVFVDVPLAQPPSPGAEVLKVMPIPFYPGDPLGEAVAAEAASYRVRF